MPDLAAYHVILVNISGGKDSEASLDVTVRAAGAAGVRDRLVTVFCDLGSDDEWPGTLEGVPVIAAGSGPVRRGAVAAIRCVTNWVTTPVGPPR